MLRRTPLKRSTKPLRRTPLKASKRPVAGTLPQKVRKVSSPEKLLKKKLWELCKQIIRKRYGNTCYTCGKEGLSGSSWQTGHFIPSSVCGIYLRYDLRNLRPQCYRCNIDLSGNGAVFYRTMVALDGQDFVNGIFADRSKIVKGDRLFLQTKIDDYTEVLKVINSPHLTQLP